MKLLPSAPARLAAGLCLLILVTLGSHAQALTIGDSRDLGTISKNYPADPLSSASFINTLLDQPLGSGPVVIGENTYTRTMNDPLSGLYPDAVFRIDLGAVTTIKLSAGDLYLLAKYDGPSWGSEVWYVGGLTGTITIPKFPVKNGKYAVSHVFLYRGGTTANRPVPDTGSAVMLLGGALAGLTALHRCVASAARR